MTEERSIKKATRVDIPEEAAGLLGDDYNVVDVNSEENPTQENPAFDEEPENSRKRALVDQENGFHPILKSLRKSFGLPTSTNTKEIEVGEFKFIIRPLGITDLTWITGKAIEFATVAANEQNILATPEATRHVSQVLVSALAVSAVKMQGVAYPVYDVFGVKPLRTEKVSDVNDPPGRIKFKAAERLYYQLATDWKHGVSEAIFASYSRIFDKANRVTSWLDGQHVFFVCPEDGNYMQGLETEAVPCCHLCGTRMGKHESGWAVFYCPEDESRIDFPNVPDVVTPHCHLCGTGMEISGVESDPLG